MLSPSVLNRILVPRRLRICLAVRRIIMCRLPRCACLTLPVAVTLKRFLAPLLVFSLGILRPPSGAIEKAPPRHALLRAGRRLERGLIATASPPRKRGQRRFAGRTARARSPGAAVSRRGPQDPRCLKMRLRGFARRRTPPAVGRCRAPPMDHAGHTTAVQGG